MTRVMLVESGPCETRVALLEQGRLAEIHYEHRDRAPTVGNIYKGRVTRVIEGIEAAFVDIGIDRDAYLFTGARDRRPEGDGAVVEPTDDDSAPRATIASERREVQPVTGRDIVVQVMKDALESKGARITSRISLPGRFLVLLPGGGSLGLSRRIEDPDERQRLQQVVADVRDPEMGLIVRTAAEGIDPERLIEEYGELVDRWSSVCREAGRTESPALLLAEEDLAERLVRDLLSEQFDQLRVEGEEAYRRLLGFVERTAPEMAAKVELHESSEPLFDLYGVEEQIERALRSRVWLKSGGTIVIHQTEALVAIDINTSRNVGRANLEETVVETNLEAVAEVVRQIRLRDLSGILVIDFIDMSERRNQERVMEALEHELTKDRSRSRLLRISEFGLVELTRKRTRSNLQSLLTRRCSSCGGSGRVASRAAICGRLRRELLRTRGDRPADRALRIVVHPTIEQALNGPQEPILAEMRQLWPGGLRLEADPALEPREFRIERRRPDSGGGDGSPGEPG